MNENGSPGIGASPKAAAADCPTADAPEFAAECDPETCAKLETAKLWSELWKEVLTSPNAGKLIEAWAGMKGTTDKHTADARVKIAELQAKNANHSNWFFVAALVLCLFFLGVVIGMLRSEKETLLPVLSALIGLIAGTGGGYVFGRQSVTGRSD